MTVYSVLVSLVLLPVDIPLVLFLVSLKISRYKFVTMITAYLKSTHFQECLYFYGLFPYYDGTKGNITGSSEMLEPGDWKQTVLYTIQFPYFSSAAKVYAIVDVIIIILSTLTLVLESIPEVNSLPYFESVSTYF